MFRLIKYTVKLSFLLFILETFVCFMFSAVDRGTVSTPAMFHSACETVCVRDISCVYVWF